MRHAPLKDAAGAVGRLALRGFLDAGGTLDLTPSATPVVSVLVLTLNRAEVTLACLRSLAAGLNRTPFEVVVVDNGSTDDTPTLLERVRGVTVLCNPTNVGFPKGVNQAAAAATGEHLLLLNNDTEVFGASIDAASRYLAGHPDVGAVGGRVVLLDGSLQEAGCVVWRDGWVDQHARSLDPGDPAVSFARDVDYCSGAFLMTPRRVFADLGGLDETFTPGYFEDVDYAVRLWQSGRRVVYLPAVAVLHHEGATSSAMTSATALFTKHHRIFAKRHADWLRLQPSRDPAAPPHTHPFRRAADAAAQVLLLLSSGTGLQTCAELKQLVERVTLAEGFVTLVIVGMFPDLPRLRAELPTTELVPLADADLLRAYLADRATTFDLALVTADADPTPLRAAGLRVLRWDGSRATPCPVE